MKRLAVGALIAVVGCAFATGRNIGYFNDGSRLDGYSLDGQLSNLKAALQGDGHNVSPFVTIDAGTLASFDVLYMQLENDSQVTSTYTNDELATLLAFNRAGGEIVWQMENGYWQQSDNDTFARLGLGIYQTAAIYYGTQILDFLHPVMYGPHGAVPAWYCDWATGEAVISDSRVKSLVNTITGNSAIPFVDCNWNGAGSAAMFFLLDVNGFSYNRPEPMMLARNMFEYDCVPEPATMAALGFGLAALAGRRRKTVR